jgi:hypothetical protein
LRRLFELAALVPVRDDELHRRLPTLPDDAVVGVGAPTVIATTEGAYNFGLVGDDVERNE